MSAVTFDRFFLWDYLIWFKMEYVFFLFAIENQTHPEEEEEV